MFQFHMLLEECDRFLELLVDSSNHADILSLAEAFDCYEALEAARMSVIRNFLPFYHSEAFRELSPESIRFIVLSAEMKATSNEHPLNVFMKWASYNSSRFSYINDIIPYLNLLNVNLNALDEIDDSGFDSVKQKVVEIKL